MSINVLYVEGTSEKLRRTLRSHKIRSTFYTEKTLKLTVVTVKQSNSVNLNGLQNGLQMNAKDLSGIAIVIRMKLLNTAGKQITTLTGIRRKLLIGKAGYFLARSKKPYIF